MVHTVPAPELRDGTSSPLLVLDAELARKILEAAPTILYVYDVQKERGIFQNRRIGDLLGHSAVARDSDQNTDWMAFIHPDDTARFSEHRAKLREMRSGEMLSWEFRMRDGEGKWRWFLSRDSLLSSDHRGDALLVVGSASDITEQKLAEQHKELLADEMRHRARNLVSIVQAIARMSRPQNQPEANKYIDAFMGRLLTLLNTGGIVLSSASRIADFETVVNTTLAPFRTDSRSTRITTRGPTIAFLERTAGGLALAVHELATNALKYGALSAEAGTVALTWMVSGADAKRRFAMEWSEVGGPPVSVPASEGFGAMVIRQSVAHETDGRVALEYQPNGLRCRLEFQISES